MAHWIYRCLVCEYTYVSLRMGIADDFAGAMCVCGFAIYSRCICWDQATKRIERNAIHSRTASARSTNQYMAINYWYIRVMIRRCLFTVDYISFLSRLVRSIFHDFCILGYLFVVFSYDLFFDVGCKFFPDFLRLFFSLWPMHWVHTRKFRIFHVGKLPIIIHMKN